MMHARCSHCLGRLDEIRETADGVKIMRCRSCGRMEWQAGKVAPITRKLIECARGIKRMITRGSDR
ncbi:MAG: hypothetical protein KGK01_12485 [Bradyrhizobium sp.]|nr:hypothetical protein [Pseudomonadota bacterium]MDE2066410.1 hypothetical protein [Bradyrhizobium sp.]MDE2243219.1 hypothetical protein [Bradyrhizobium sp.]MDE2470154.1 hypothetical protein [Bradyrhizobium sp.]